MILRKETETNNTETVNGGTIYRIRMNDTP